MVNFFLIVDANGTIQKVKWRSPSKNIYEGQSILEILDDYTAVKVLSSLQRGPVRDNYDCFPLYLKSESKMARGSLYLIKMEDYTIAMGLSGRANRDPVIKELIKAYNDDTQKRIRKANFILKNLNRDLQSKLARDSLTGLIGRHQFIVGIRSMIDSDPDKYGIFVYIDIDDFKDVNDTYGHIGGDQFLIEFAKRLKSMPLQNSMIIRIAGDEFGIFIYGLKSVDENDLNRIWEMLEEYVLKNPVIFNQMAIPVSVSVGMTLYGVDTDDVKKMIDYADFAMYQAKRKGKKQFQRFDKEEFKIQRVMKLQSKAVRQVLEERDLYHVYQPIVSSVDGQIFAYAALMRTNNDFFRDTTDLIEHAFRENLYLELDLLSFNKLVQEKEISQKIEEKLLFVAHGPYSLHRNSEIKKIKENIFRNRLVLEIVEGQMAKSEDIEEIIRNAEEFGYLVAISGFATGAYDDLGMLTTCPAFVKLGRRISENIDKDKGKQNKVRKLVKYAHTQGTRVVMEGIETKQEMEMAIQLEVDYLQGYYLGVPSKDLPGEKIEVKAEIIKTRNDMLSNARPKKAKS